MTNLIMFCAFFLLMFAVGLIAARIEARQRSLFCTNCDHTMLMHYGRRKGPCRSYSTVKDRQCRCLGGHPFVPFDRRPGGEDA